MKSWEQMSEHEQLSAIHYDAYKDAYGFRPRHVDYSLMSVEEIRAEIDLCAAEIDRQNQERMVIEAEASERFEETVKATIAAGAGDRETALRWIMDSTECGGDWEYFCYLHDLPYGYFKTNEVTC